MACCEKWFALNRGGSWYPTPLTGWMTWLDQDNKTEEDHLNIEKLQLCCYIMPTHYLIYGNVRYVINNKLKMHPTGVPTLKKKKTFTE